MSKEHIEYEKPKDLPCLGVSVDAFRVELAKRIHNPNNCRSTAAFLDTGLAYFESQLLYDVAVKLCRHVIHWGNGKEFKQHRQRVVESVVAVLRGAGAVQEDLLRSSDYYCGRFRLCLGRGCADPAYLDLWLVPVKPSFFWGNEYPGVPDAFITVHRRQWTGLADLRWVAPLNRGGQL